MQYCPMDAQLSTLTSDYTASATDTLANAVYLRLMTPLGSWFADPSLGSRLHELQRNKDLERVRRLAIEYSQAALAPLVDDGRAESVSVSAYRDVPGRLDLLIEVVDPTGRAVRWLIPVKVGAV